MASNFDITFNSNKSEDCFSNKIKNNNDKNTSNDSNKKLALVKKGDLENFNFQLSKKQNSKKETILTQQFLTLSLLEYICNLLSPRDKNRAEIQYRG
jgi:hypothetical protein